MIVDLMGRVAEERARQEEKWGEQNHPDTFPFDIADNWEPNEEANCNELGIPTEYGCKMYNAELVESGTLYWYAILMEEVAEAHAAASEGDDDRQIEELIQVMAVCAAHIDCIQRRRKGA